MKVDSRPVSKHSVVRGWVKSKKKETVTYSHLTVVKNTKSIPIQLIVSEQLPISEDETVVVAPLNPSQDQLDAAAKAIQQEEADAAEAEANPKGKKAVTARAAAASGTDKVALNPKTHNVSFARTVKPQQEEHFVFEYSVQHLAVQPICFTER